MYKLIKFILVFISPILFCMFLNAASGNQWGTPNYGWVLVFGLIASFTIAAVLFIED